MPRPTVKMKTKVNPGVATQARRAITDLRTYLSTEEISQVLAAWPITPMSVRQEILSKSPLFSAVIDLCSEVARKVNG